MQVIILNSAKESRVSQHLKISIIRQFLLKAYNSLDFSMKKTRKAELRFTKLHTLFFISDTVT